MAGPITLMQRLVATEIRAVLPYSFNRKTLHPFIAQVLDDEMEPRSMKIIFDFARLRFVDPTAITSLANLFAYCKSRGVSIHFGNHTYDTEGNKYLDDSGFFEAYLGKKMFPNSKLRETTLPLTNVSHDRSFAWINYSFLPWISKRVGLSEKSFAYVNLCLAELFNNILDHSGEKSGCVFAQHYPKENEVMLAISDFGVGIPFNVRKKVNFDSDSEAIAKAMEDGFTTNSTPGNRGAGLAILAKTVVFNNRGSIVVHSLKGCLEYIYSAGGPKPLLKTQQIAYPGTLVQIKFRTDYLEQVVVKKEDFQW